MSKRTVGPLPIGLTGATGFAGSLCVLIGVAQTGSPFALKVPGAWFFGTGAGVHGAPGRSNFGFLGVILVYAGVALMLGSWFEIVRALRRRPPVAFKRVLPILIAWAVPVLAMPPLFSRDVYSYAAQGEMVARGLNPYGRGPSSLGHGSFLALVDPLWRHAHAPYGPAWERLSGWVVQLSGHDVLHAIVGFRLVALVGVALIAWGVPVLARSVGRDGTVAVAVAVLNPLVLLVLLGGAHNDALMLGLLVAGCALARSNRPLAGLVLCALAAEVKVPALIGAAFIGWWWSDARASWPKRLPRAAAAVLAGAGFMAALSAVCGLGWRWLSGLSNPGVVVSWLDPASAVGLLLGHAASLVGYGGHATAFVQAARGVGLVLAALISVALILRSERVGLLPALGWSLLAFVVLGPVVWPWYETWGFVFLAIAAQGWTLRFVLAFSAVACFADVPPLHFLAAADPAVSVVGWLVLIGAVGAYGTARLLPSLTRPLRSRPPMMAWPDLDAASAGSTEG
ncbi:MAG TPA: polyprenol phosphomannose-dependent alpha 1,6 mannosyltransferase MptB [Acidimicrobiales bacterium]|nr:polyprenol phosphomannose-dependent alpha 1,6 mannosyltransferase MptB [Acidimicrobiales bacterium]